MSRRMVELFIGKVNLIRGTRLGAAECQTAFKITNIINIFIQTNQKLTSIF
jgi:hypothetical protein